jgi:hypothetical protein
MQQMIEVKTTELEGAALDWVASQVLGCKIHATNTIAVKVDADGYFPVKTCRAIVAAKLGDVVSVPAELVS